MFGMSSWILQCSHPVLISNIAICAVFFDFNKIVVTLCGPDEPFFRFDGTLSKYTESNNNFIEIKENSTNGNI
jgi:hypothetical protein